MSDKFQITFQVDDGYAGGSRPQRGTAYASDIGEDMTDDDLISLYEEIVRDEFELKIHPYGTNASEFMAWAKERIQEMENG